MNSKLVYKQIMDITSNLIEIGICDDQNFPSIKEHGNKIKEVSLSNTVNLFLKDIYYDEIYKGIRDTRSFNIKLLDGALIIMQYEFSNEEIERSRLLFLPAPDLITYQESFEIYENDEIYADILYKQRVCFPIRFDFDKRDDVFKELEHPISHLTLGQYEHCRIPVSSALSPYQFIDFIIRNFYSSLYRKNIDKLKKFHGGFFKTITPLEEKIIHVNIPDS